jgi:hypothetical protein
MLNDFARHDIDTTGATVNLRIGGSGPCARRPSLARRRLAAVAADSSCRHGPQSLNVSCVTLT